MTFPRYGSFAHVMRVLVCPTAFKESLSATEVADAIAAGVRRAIPAAGIRTMPLSDGGSGLIETLAAAAGGREARISTTDPLGRPVEARVLWTDAEAVVIESAEACGLHLLAPKERVPLQTATDGVGALLERCAADGARRAILGLGGSATVDGGTGMARALGWRFLDVDGRKLAPGGASWLVPTYTTSASSADKMGIVDVSVWPVSPLSPESAVSSVSAVP
ncbi:MAG: glycerate kinase, partial [Gemmatimonadota bacterium]